jgi:hypothetical protein
MLQAQFQSQRQSGKRYTWPWFVLGAVVLGILLAVLWLSREIDRTRRFREFNTPAPQTNQPATQPQ